MDTEKYINSGIVELFVMGSLTSEEENELTLLASQHPEIRAEIERVSITLETYAQSTAQTPDPAIKPMLMATLDYMHRLENGESPVIAPLLSKNSKKEDFSHWLNRTDMQAPAEYDHTFVKIIYSTPSSTTATVWLKEGAPNETHTNEYESLFILEGSCDILIDSSTHQLFPGDQLTIPLHVPHTVKVTSTVPCKLILERRAA